MAGRRGGIVNPLLSVVLPVGPDAEAVDKIIQRLMAVPLRIELIVVGQGVTPPIRDLVLALGRAYRFTFIDEGTSGGRGAALRRGLAALTGDLVVIQNADLDYAPETLPELIALICQGRADVVFGSRVTLRQRRCARAREVGGRALTLIANMLYNTRLTDMETGYKVMRTDLVRSFRLDADGADIEAELTARILKGGSRVYEVPIGCAERPDRGRRQPSRDRLAAARTLVTHRFTA